jgi:hypothetical protein
MARVFLQQVGIDSVCAAIYAGADLLQESWISIPPRADHFQED